MTKLNECDERRRQALLTTRAGLVARMGATARDLAQTDKPKGEDFTQLRHEHAVLTASNHAATEQLRNVDAAIAKLEAGEYGSCENCEEPISEARLSAVPAARFCLACQEISENLGREARIGAR